MFSSPSGKSPVGVFDVEIRYELCMEVGNMHLFGSYISKPSSQNSGLQENGEVLMM